MKLLEKRHLITIHFVIFLDKNTDFKAIEVSKLISDKLGDIFTNDPNIVSKNHYVNNNHLPKILFKERNYGLNITPQKIDFIFNNRDNDQNYQDTILNTLGKLIAILKDDLQVIIHRIGLVMNFAIPPMKQFDVLLNNQSVTSDTSDYHEVNFSWLEKLTIDKIPLNKWQRYLRKKSKTKQDIISVDINTLPEVDLNYVKVDLKTLLKDIMDYVKSEL